MMYALDIQTVSDKMIACKEIRPMLIACPRMDDSLGLNAYESYFFDEVVPLVERLYHTGTRHIGGFSAGGYNALRYALLHPELFACVGGHMPSIDDRMEDEGKFYQGCARLSPILENKYARVQNHLNKGHHDMMYIKANLEYYLKFYSQRWRQAMNAVLYIHGQGGSAAESKHYRATQ